MNELEEKAVNDIERELEVSKQFPYLHKPREVAKQLVLRCGYGKVKEYQEEIDRLKAENMELASKLETIQKDKENLERTMEEVSEALDDSGIRIDCDGNVDDGRKLLESHCNTAEQERRTIAKILCSSDDGVSPCGGKCAIHELCTFLSLADTLLAVGFGDVKKAQIKVLEKVIARLENLYCPEGCDTYYANGVLSAKTEIHLFIKELIKEASE